MGNSRELELAVVNFTNLLDGGEVDKKTTIRKGKWT
jgi:hypothetical protein